MPFKNRKAANPLFSPEEVAETHRILARVRSQAYGRTRIKLFSQSPGSGVHTVLARNQVKGGICCALSLYWLKGQLSDPVNNQGYLNSLMGQGGSGITNAIMPAIQLNNAIKAPDTQLQDANIWLHDSGFTGAVKRKKSVSWVSAGVSDYFCEAPSINPYRLIAIRGGYDHAMALDLVNLEFFDPNIGAFQFKHLMYLKNFLNDTVFPLLNRVMGSKESNYLGRHYFSLVQMGCYRKNINRQYFSV
ncbi:YopT-type cysteine protease domain-containing protein [Microbulbifer sp. A4B17]|uniref:YopT-type cysteine protease domain-containing protein n=1 Tax=Microbulbifer sp. A4B17 TaxID=359370 RepID=UPI0013003D21|nr:YopT-type cysteine protease domain-containing protein [Microbulbifer sp. A4B17]